MLNEPQITIANLKEKAQLIRKNVLDVAIRNQAGHIAPSLSCLEILVTLYYSIMKLDENPTWAHRDRFILSKSHGCYALYAILADIGYLDHESWLNFNKGSFLKGCIERSPEHGIEASCGSLGHGLPIAVGIAFAAKLKRANYRTYCLVGDGEMQEGSMWEAVQFAVHHQLSNLVIIVDRNRLQAMDFTENILGIPNIGDNLENKFNAFGCFTKVCNGHAIDELHSILSDWNENFRKFHFPQVLIANTIKGYGVKCMENVPKFHYRVPSQEELNSK